MSSSKSLGLEFNQLNVCSSFATNLLDDMGRSQPSQCNFLFYKVMPIAWQYVAQELQKQMSTTELLKANTVEMQLIIAEESADTLHLLL